MQETTPVTRRIVYNDAVVRAFTLATTVWGVVALLLGVIIATQLSFWQANLASWLNFGRLRPLHTNAAIFAFVGNMIFAGVYYSTQRLTKARLASDFLGWFHFWGWQLIIVGAAITLPLGLTQGKEYAELIWPLDLAVVVVWVAFGVNFFWTLARRNEKNLYVALWFYIATIVTVAILYIVNNLQIPTGPLHSYSIFTGVQDALVQWWYGHNAVAFVLTTPILGIMYYYLPKAAGRPVYSYRLSIVHFWSLIFIYIWAGPHHLLNTALPDWAQTLGMIFSVMLWAPSWGGMLNGLLTLRGAWDKLRTDPVIKFFIVAVTFYGMSTFEGPLLAIKSVNALAHYTDWIIGHVHGGTLGWNGFMAAGMIYWLVPRLWGTKLYSKRMADAHFWIGTFGILLYIVAMWISGVSQGLFWRALDADGFLKYPDFIEGLLASRFLYQMRLIGGLAYFTGFILMGVNVVATVAKGKATTAEIEVTGFEKTGPGFWRLIFSAPVIFSFLIVASAVVLGAAGILTGIVALVFLEVLTVALIISFGSRRSGKSWHEMVEGNSLAFTVLVLVAILIGGVVEIIPTVVIQHRVPKEPTVSEASLVEGSDSLAVALQAQEAPADSSAAAPAPAAAGEASATPTAEGSTAAPAAGGTTAAPTPAAGAETAGTQAAKYDFHQRPYSPLELEGRDIYIAEGCYVCHSQMIRPFRHETLRYGEYSRASEFVYDTPFQWGSKRTGPDLHRVGGKYPNQWHYLHLKDPRSTSPGSIMPSYAFLMREKVPFIWTMDKMRVLKRLGVPYTDEEIHDAAALALQQGRLISEDLAKESITLAPDSKMTALIAYLQRLGRGPQFIPEEAPRLTQREEN